MNNDLKNHWENIYSNKDENEVSWFQTVPKTSHQLIKKLNLESNDNIIDIGSSDYRMYIRVENTDGNEQNSDDNKNSFIIRNYGY